MSRIEKLYRKISRYPVPNDILFSEVDRILKFYGFQQRQPSGGSSHYTYTHPELKRFRITVTRGRKGTVKRGYIKKIVEGINLIREMQGGE